MHQPIFTLTNRQPFRLIPSEKGRHSFGGKASHAGVIPAGTEVAIQAVISLDLTDPLFSIRDEIAVSKLVLYYPFKYGCGGPEIQYAVRSDSQIEILYLSDSVPDEKEFQYLQVEELPFQRMALEPLTYEQARILSFVGGYFQPSDEDHDILDKLDMKNLVTIDGRYDYVDNAPDIICRNSACEFYERRVCFDSVIMVPPISIKGNDDFWCDFQGGDVIFCFGLCYCCGTVIAFNVAS